jgi:hypothetical protein
MKKVEFAAKLKHDKYACMPDWWKRGALQWRRSELRRLR